MPLGGHFSHQSIEQVIHKESACAFAGLMAYLPTYLRDPTGARFPQVHCSKNCRENEGWSRSKLLSESFSRVQHGMLRLSLTFSVACAKPVCRQLGTLEARCAMKSLMPSGSASAATPRRDSNCERPKDRSVWFTWGAILPTSLLSSHWPTYQPDLLHGYSASNRTLSHT